jgi:hypothetical protein
MTRRLFPALITTTVRKPPIPKGHRQWLDLGTVRREDRTKAVA